jgi:hypothetical protein
MDLLSQPQPFAEAVKHWLAKNKMATPLDSAQLKQLDSALRRQSLFSARTEIESYLDSISGAIHSILAPRQEARPDQDQTVTVGLNPATARSELRDALQKLGYQAAPGTEGTITDLSSAARINLVVKTNSELAWGAGQFVKQNLNEDVVDLYPAIELVRIEEKDKPRDWEQRWRIAAQVANDPAAAAALELHGRMVALKDSDIWQELGDGAGGYDDTLGNPYPPFAFNSGMWTEDVDRADAEELGLLDAGESAKPALFSFAGLFKAAA